MTSITSPANPRIKALQDLHTARGRKRSGLFLMEGPHLLISLLNAHVAPREIYYQPAILQRTLQGRELLQRFSGTAYETQLIEVSERVIEVIGDVQTSQGIVSVLPIDEFTLTQTRHRRPDAHRPVLLILDDIADPGNMGTILRTALAANVEAVLLTPHCVDCFSPKVVRAAAGAHVALPLATDQTWEEIGASVAQHCAGRVLLAEAGSPHIYYEQDLKTPFALIVGNEAHGPSDSARALATQTITIPLANAVESLNAAMAAGIILYEAVRQRNK